MSHLSRFHAVRYRGISGLQLDDIRAVNLITGPNGVGKTSLLEAIWLFNGRFAPSLLWHSAVQRSAQTVTDATSALGGDSIEMHGTERGTATTWRAAFEPGALAVVAGRDSNPRGNGTASPSGRQADTNQAAIPLAGRLRVWLDGKDLGGSGEMIHPHGRVIVPIMTRPAGLSSATVHLPKALMDTEADLIRHFSALVQRGAKTELRERLRLVLPRLADVEVITSSDGQPFVLATTDDGERLPLQALGGGMQRLFGLFVGFHECRGGIVLIDEIENGLHHTVLPELWRQLRTLAREFDVQIFATTHSQECLLAALEAFDDDADEGGEEPETTVAVQGLYRKREDSSVRAVTFADETLAGARHLQLELR